MKNALKYFKKLADIEETYVPYLYMSYAFEYLGNQTGKKRYNRRAKKAIIKAYRLVPASTPVILRLEELGVSKSDL